MSTITGAQLIALVAAMPREEKLALREAMRAGVTPEQAAASAAYVEKGHACTATPPCSRTGFRTAGRASKHGVDDGGHTAATA